MGLKANSPPCKNIVIQFTRLIVRLCAGAHFSCPVPAALLPVSCIHTTHSCDNNRMPTVQKFPRRWCLKVEPSCVLSPVRPFSVCMPFLETVLRVNSHRATFSKKGANWCQLNTLPSRLRCSALWLPGLLRTNSRLSILSLWCPHLCNRGFRSVPRLRVPILMPSRIFGNWEQKQVRSRFHCSNLIPDGITTTGGWSGLILFAMRWLQTL